MRCFQIRRSTTLFT